MLREINDIDIGIGYTNAGGGISGVWLLKPRTGFSKPFDWQKPDEVFSLITDKIPGIVNYFLTNSGDGFSTLPVEGKTYFIIVTCGAWYDATGSNTAWGTIPGSHFTLTSPSFVATKENDKFIFPSEVNNLTVHWWDNSVALPVVKDNVVVRWVDYKTHFDTDPQGEGWTELTRNGLNPTCDGSGETNGFIHLDPTIANWGEYWPTNRPGSWATVIIWYNDERTDGTEWYWDEHGVTRREIPSLAIAPTNGALKVSLLGGPGRSYVLENVQMAPGSETLGSATTDTNGIATWIVQPTNGDAGFFRAHLK